MEAKDVFRIIIEGAFYDVFKLLIAPLLMSGAVVIAIRIITDKLRGKKDIILFTICSFFIFASLLYFVGSNRSQPQLVGGIQTIITGPTPSQSGSLAILTMSVINTGTMQTILKNWNVEASLNGTRYRGVFVPMPDKLIMQMPEAITSLSALTYHKEDDILIKSTSPIQVGGLVAGTLYVLFDGVDPSIFKTGSDITVTYEDALSRPYAATIKTTAKFDMVGVVPGLHTEMVCRMPPGGPAISRPP